MYIVNEIENFKYITFPVLEKYDDLFHCFTTRVGGVSQGPYSSMNLGLTSGDEKEAIIKNYHILSERLSIDINKFVKTYQTHSANIRYITKKEQGKIFDEKELYKDIDGLITDEKNLALTTVHADCTPVFFYDPVKKVIGMAHAGWRGTLGNIGGKMARKFMADFGSRPEDIKVAIGPSLEQKCFEVDKDVAEMFMAENSKYIEFMETRGEKYYFDLWKINEYSLLEEGIKEKNIEIAGLCTKCNQDLFFSHRGQKGKRGLMAGIIMMK